VYPDVRDAVAASHLRDLPPDVLDELLDGAIRVFGMDEDAAIVAGPVARPAR
jgi:hypothetical protein